MCRVVKKYLCQLYYSIFANFTTRFLPVTDLVISSRKIVTSIGNALAQQLIDSSAARLTSLILVNRETLLQACLLPVTLYAVIFSLASVQVQSGGGNPSVVSSMPSGVAHGPFDSASAYVLPHTPTCTQAKHQPARLFMTAPRLRPKFSK